MVTLIALACAGAYVALLLLKAAGAALAVHQSTHRVHQPLPPDWQREVALLQPILGGDPLLARVLTDNLEALPQAQFVWLLDEDDALGRATAAQLVAAHPLHRIDCRLHGAVPDDVNPKTFKLAAALPEVRQAISVVIDDDTRLGAAALRQMVCELDGADLVTALPCYRDDGAPGARLMAQFVNNNAALTYLPLLPLMPPLSINGMCYALRTDRLRALGGFAPLSRQLADDLALARALRRARRAATPVYRLRRSADAHAQPCALPPTDAPLVPVRHAAAAQRAACPAGGDHAAARPASAVASGTAGLRVDSAVRARCSSGAGRGGAAGARAVRAAMAAHRPCTPQAAGLAAGRVAATRSPAARGAGAAHPLANPALRGTPPTMIFMHSESDAPRLQLAFLTGQSNPSCCALSPAQQTFGQALLAPGRVLHPRNFPYWPDTPAHQATPLWRASWYNTAHYLRSRRPDFAQRHAQDVLRLLADASHTVLLTGSCGLELLANLHLPPEASRQISVLAYGPVARRTPACAQLLSVVRPA